MKKTEKKEKNIPKFEFSKYLNLLPSSFLKGIKLSIIDMVVPTRLIWADIRTLSTTNAQSSKVVF